MCIIKFGYDYVKFFEDVEDMPCRRVVDGAVVRLLEVFTVERKELSPAFVEDDTLIYKEDDDGEREYYPLPDGLLLVLLFRTLDGFMFTTLRWWTEEKEAYYLSQRGKRFDVRIDMGVG